MDIRKKDLQFFFRVTNSLFIVSTFLLMLFYAKITSPVSAQGTNCSVSGSLSPTSQEQTLLGLINNYRQQHGVPALTWSNTLKQAALWLSNDMNTNNYFSHTDSLGRTPGPRLTQCGYAWSAFAENIYPNGSDPQAAFEAWKNSSSHNASMLNASYKEAGIGTAGSYWTLDLGSASSSNNNQNPTSPPVVSTPTPTVLPTLTSTPFPTPTPTPSIIINPTDTKVNINIRLAGIGEGGNTLPKHLTRQVVIGVYDLNNKQVKTGNGHLKYNGKNGFAGDIHLGQLTNGVYYLKVVSANTLVSLIVPEFQTLASDKPNILPQVILIQGDFNFDNSINIEDFNAALPCFQDKNCQAKDVIDLNDDGRADVMDYNIFLASFKRAAGD